MSENINDLVASILEDISTNAPIEVDLPSRGIGYSSDSGSVKIKAMSFADEKSAAQAALGQPGFDHLSYMISKCVEGVDPEELYMFDKVFILLKLRQATYGEEFKSEIQCPECGDKSVVSFNLNQVPVKYVDGDFSDPREIMLPRSKKKCKIFSPRKKHEKLLKSSKSTMDNLWRFIHSFEGHENKEVISKVIDKLPMTDVNWILKSLIQNYGIDTKVQFACGGCGHVELTEMPFNTDFFTEN